MLGQKFRLKGQYLRAPKHRLYLQLKLSGLGDATGTMLQVSDGQTLWDYQQVLSAKSFRKIDIGKIFKKLDEPGFDAEIRRQIVGAMGFSGPDALLSGLRKAMKFHTVVEGTLHDRPVLIFYGTWKDNAMLSGQQAPAGSAAPAPNPNALPSYVPSIAHVWVGKDDGWPYLVEIEGRVPAVVLDTRIIGPDGKPIGAKTKVKEVEPTKIVLTYTNVQVNADLKAESFAFQPPDDANVLDETERLLAVLEQSTTAAEMRKKAADASQGEALPQIPVPSPDGAAAPAPLDGLAPPAPPTPAPKE
jgi:hypothetical protein